MFKLTDYLDEIRAISENKGCTLTAAVDLMILNLNTFNEYNKGTGTLSYRVIGQEWGNLSAAQKVAQKQEAKSLIVQSATKRAGRANRWR